MENIELTNEEYLENAILCLQRKGQREGILAVPYKDLEAYVRIVLDDYLDENGLPISFALPAEVTIEGLPERAAQNTESKFRFMSMASILGVPEDDFLMDVITTDTNQWGSSILLFPKVLHNYCELKGLTDLILIPSSVHEMIILEEGRLTEEELTTMIKQVNATEVREDEVLSDHPYRFHHDLKGE